MIVLASAACGGVRQLPVGGGGAGHGAPDGGSGGGAPVAGGTGGASVDGSGPVDGGARGGSDVAEPDASGTQTGDDGAPPACSDSDTDCQPANPCRTGATSCATGGAACVETGIRPDGFECGSNLVCRAGDCVTCRGGEPCTPANACHLGMLVCSSGIPVCIDTGTKLADGTGCGTNQVCRGDLCLPCVSGQSCQPTNPCKYGVTSCSTGASVCTESGDRPSGTPCGGSQSCTGGIKIAEAQCNATHQCVSDSVRCDAGCNLAGTDCGSCPSGEMICGTVCRNLASDPMNCKTCGAACPVPAAGSGAATCSSGQCGVACASGYQACLESYAYCQIRNWDFEDGKTGFTAPPSDSTLPNNVTAVSVSTARAHSGTRSMAVAVKAPQGDARSFSVVAPLCEGKTGIAANGQRVSAWLYLDPAPGSPALHDQSMFEVRAYSDSANGGDVVVRSTVRQWFQLSTTISRIGDALYKIGIEGYINGDGTSAYDWTGTIYVDDIAIQ